MFTFIAILFFIIGFFNFFAKDVMWSLTSIGGPLEGLPAEHNESWDGWSTIRGIIAILIGLVFWVYA